MPNADVMTGTVKWYNESKGYGFINPDGGGTDMFVHASAVSKSGIHRLDEGDRVSYEVANNQKTGKNCAVNLKRM